MTVPGMVGPPYYEVTVRLPLALYTERWFDEVADAAGSMAAVSGSVVPGPVCPHGDHKETP